MLFLVYISFCKSARMATTEEGNCPLPYMYVRAALHIGR